MTLHVHHMYTTCTPHVHYMYTTCRSSLKGQQLLVSFYNYYAYFIHVGSLQGAGWRRTESEALDVIDDVDDDDVDLDDSCFPVTDPVTTPPDVGGASAVGGGGRLHHNEVEQDWRTAIN